MIMEAIFRQVKIELSSPNQESGPNSPLILYIDGNQVPNTSFSLLICVTDFHTNTWQARKSLHDLEDMRDVTGIGGSWSEFLDYVTASFMSEDLKIVMEEKSKSGGITSAKIIAQKGKGMPRISISLSKLVDATASDVMANMSFELFKQYECVHNILTKDQEHICRLTNLLKAEQEKNESLRKQLDALEFSSKRQKSDKISDMSTSGQDSPGKRNQTGKVSSRIVPTHRRAKVRGALLQDTEE
ncbi:hypothetical protein LIER_03655 [Lithospermum erythrorhizon]|uniref:Uncharacterized protein n=1 Tax=Lithospermum erythrorhizon TaxID=34254 RepID=A0AAV3NTW4_LITER